MTRNDGIRDADAAPDCLISSSEKNLVIISFVKSLVPGALLTWLVAMFIGTAGSTGGYLYIHYLTVETYSWYWSWPLFIFGTGLAFVIYAVMDL
ncbi:hypothetical protein [Qipengyuania atrilutea]|uniref:hypothetical protein n=1 Tax=Qipengyuania atrilutea TaxID=2744473 RepID=UPI001C3D4C61|nr:hypothetical protein [Actirhodobacter atriluteus]